MHLALNGHSVKIITGDFKTGSWYSLEMLSRILNKFTLMIALLSHGWAFADSGPCLAFLEDTKAYANSAFTSDSDERFERILTFLMERGFSADFIEKLLDYLIIFRFHYDLQIFDSRTPEFKQFVKAHTPADVRQNILRNKSGGVFFTVRNDDGRLKFVIALNPASRTPPIELTLTEELLHARFRDTQLHMRLNAAEKDSGSTPYLLTEAGSPLLTSLDEFVVKEVQMVSGLKKSRNRDEILGILLSYTEKSGDVGVKGFSDLSKTLVVCAENNHTTWREISLFKLIRCASRFNGAQELNTQASKYTIPLTELLKSAVSENSRLFAPAN